MSTRESRFKVIVKEYVVRWSGCADRIFAIVDKTRRNAIVAHANATFPEAEQRMRDYCDFLNASDPWRVTGEARSVPTATRKSS